jgi:hypothetical protein
MCYAWAKQDSFESIKNKDVSHLEDQDLDGETRWGKIRKKEKGNSGHKSCYGKIEENGKGFVIGKPNLVKMWMDDGGGGGGDL